MLPALQQNTKLRLLELPLRTVHRLLFRLLFELVVMAPLDRILLPFSRDVFSRLTVRAWDPLLVLASATVMAPPLLGTRLSSRNLRAPSHRDLRQVLWAKLAQLLVRMAQEMVIVLLAAKHIHSDAAPALHGLLAINTLLLAVEDSSPLRLSPLLVTLRQLVAHMPLTCVPSCLTSPRPTVVLIPLQSVR